MVNGQYRGQLAAEYLALGIPPGATEEVAKKAYRKLRSVYHPDRTNDQATRDHFGTIQRAYDAIQAAGFPTADRLLNATIGQQAAETGAKPFDFGQAWRRPRAARSIKRTIRLTLEEAALGVIADIAGTMREACEACDGRGFTREAICPHCSGGGFTQKARVETDEHGRTSTTFACPRCEAIGTIKQACPSCNGAGETQGQRQYSVRVRIPPGLRDGEELTVDVQGDDPYAPAAKMLLRIELQRHERFWFDEDGMLCCRVNVSLLEYVAQAEVCVPTIWGERRVRLRTGRRTLEVDDAGFPDRTGKTQPLRVRLIVDESPLQEPMLSRVREVLSGKTERHRREKRKRGTSRSGNEPKGKERNARGQEAPGLDS